MKKNLYIIIYPYKFTNFIWELNELDSFLKYTDVQVLDISKIINFEFSQNIAAKNIIRKEVIYISTVLALISYIRNLKVKSSYTNICIYDEIPKNSMICLTIKWILFLYLKDTKIKCFDSFNSGVPIIYSKEIAQNKNGGSAKIVLSKLFSLLKSFSNTKEFKVKIFFYFSNNLSNLIPSVLTHHFIAGKHYKIYAQKKNKYLKRFIYGHSFDYSNYLKLRDRAKIKVKNNYKTSIFLDGAGPLFKSDSFYTKRSVPFTTEVWYPALTNFFDFLEKNTGVTVDVAGHYKSTHISPAPIFGYRNVIYGETLMLVKKSDYVITRCSSAISFAVLYRKPILFIFSDQLIQDNEVMRHINGMAEMLGTKPINIDHFSDDINNYLKVNEKKYREYENNFLTSNSSGRQNYQIILEDIMKIPTDISL